MHIPEFMPVLKMGGHDHPAKGACVMEYVSFITGDEFTDAPECTPRALGLLAQMTNDMQDTDEERSERLLPLMPRLIGAGQSNEFDEILCEWLFKKGLAVKPEDRQVKPRDPYGDLAPAGGTHHQTCARGKMVAILLGYIYTKDRPTKDLLVDLLSEALDLYDEFLGRDKTETLTDEQVVEVKRLHDMIVG